MKKSTVYYIDYETSSDDIFSLDLKNVLLDYNVKVIKSTNEALLSIKSELESGLKIPLIFVGDKVLNKFGSSFFFEIKKLAHLTNIILLTAERKIELISKSIKNIGLYNCVPKALIKNNLTLIVNEAIKNYDMNEQIEYSYKIDSLTRIYNRSTLLKDLEKAENPTILLVNIDDFRDLNATYGYKCGDDFLKKVAKYLNNKTVENNIYRLISDEFVYLFDNKNEDEIYDFAKKLQLELQNKDFIINNKSINMTFSMSISYSGKTIIEDAQTAIHESMKSSKNTLSFAYEVKKEKENAFTLQNLQMAFDDDNIMPFYQGIRDNKSGKIAKYECLVRVKDSKGLVVSPNIFLELAQSSGLMTRLTKLVIDKSFIYFKDKEDTFSINITEDDLRKNYIVDYVQRKGLEHKLDLKRVTFEILENIQSENSSLIPIQLKGLQELGCKIAFDDFGCDKSNFSRLMDLNIDIVKIDRMFIQNIHKDEKSFKLARAITNLAKDFDCQVIAEGVECIEAQRLVEELNIDYTQGYYYCKPEEEVL